MNYIRLGRAQAPQGAGAAMTEDGALGYGQESSGLVAPLNRSPVTESKNGAMKAKQTAGSDAPVDDISIQAGAGQLTTGDATALNRGDLPDSLVPAARNEKF